MIKNFLVAFFLLVLTVNAEGRRSWWKLIPSETGNHCKDQVFGHLRYLFGEEIQFEGTFQERCQGRDSNCFTWYRTNLCRGYFVAINVRGNSCTSAHYGFVPIYVRRIWGYGDCKRLLPKDVYPRWDNTDRFIRRKS